MSLLLLDTTFLVDAHRRDKQLDAAMADDDDVAIAAVTAAELLVGVELSTGTSRSRRREFLEAVIATVPVVSYDLPCPRLTLLCWSLSADKAGPEGPRPDHRCNR